MQRASSPQLRRWAGQLHPGLGLVQLCGLPPLLLQKNAPCSTECGAQYEAKRNETVPTLVIIYDSTAISELEP